VRKGKDISFQIACFVNILKKIFTFQKPTGFALTPGLNEPFVAGKTLTPDSFKCLVMCKIAPASGHDEPGFFSDKLEAISEACPQFSDAPISSKTRTPKNTDAGYWGHELGENGYVGILKVKTTG
jgi:hypothetical protein